MHYAKKSHIPRKPASLSSICELFVLDPEAWKFCKVMSSEFFRISSSIRCQSKCNANAVANSFGPWLVFSIYLQRFQLNDIICIRQRAGYLFIKLWTAHSRGIGLWQYFFVVGRNRRMTTPIMECLLLLKTGCNKVWITRAPSVPLQRFPVGIYIGWLGR